MASLIKRDKRPNWIAKYTNHKGKRVERSTKTSDKRAAERIAAKWQAEEALKREGVIDPAVADFNTHAKRPIEEHIHDYRKYLESKNTTKHTSQQIGFIERVVQGGGITAWTGITADSVSNALDTLQYPLGDEDESPRFSSRTRNAYLTAIKGLCNWMVKRDRSPRNPLNSLEPTPTEKREHRRALSHEEAQRLILSALKGEPIIWRTKAGAMHYRHHKSDMPGGIRCLLTGEDRALLYRFAMETSQRLSAIDRLTVGDFELEDLSGALVRVKAKAKTKSRQTLIVPLQHETARLLANRFKGKPQGTKAFDLPENYEAADMIRADLKAARVAWLSEAADAESGKQRALSDFLSPEDHEGRRVDFHALRTTCASWLHHAGTVDSTAMRITGHTVSATLQNNYQRSNLEQTRAALAAAMPPLPTAELIAPEKHHHIRHHSVHNPVHPDAPQCSEDGGGAAAKELGKASLNKAKCDSMQLNAPRGGNASSRTRTWNPLIKSQKGPVVTPCESSENEFGADSTTINATTLEQWGGIDLVRLVEVWPELPEAIRAAIVALVNSQAE